MRPTKKQIREYAKKFYDKDGELEIDDNAQVNPGSDRGAYVQAWSWVSYDEIKGV